MLFLPYTTVLQPRIVFDSKNNYSLAPITPAVFYDTHGHFKGDGKTVRENTLLRIRLSELGVRVIEIEEIFQAFQDDRPKTKVFQRE